MPPGLSFKSRAHRSNVFSSRFAGVPGKLGEDYEAKFIRG
jgi:hypothetical protein